MPTARYGSFDAMTELPTVAVERRRLDVARKLDPASQARLGQVFTPAAVARFIASLLGGSAEGESVRLLDPGAGVGCLTAAAVERLVLENEVQRIEIVASEIDPALQGPLEHTLSEVSRWAGSCGVNVTSEIRKESYLDVGTLEGDSRGLELGSFDAVIMNPPYGKLGARSPERRALEQLGIATANLYTAFMALGVLHLREGGRLAAITPRSFANGLYHEPFRRFFFEAARLSRIHLFAARDLVFADSNVLQENLVLSVERGGDGKNVVVSSSHGPEDEPISRDVPYAEVVSPDDPHQFLRIPTEREHTDLAEWVAHLPATLGELGLAVSTGRVVEFRSKEFLCDQPREGAVPLIHPTHLKAERVKWPLPPGGKKPNALLVAAETERLLLPNEAYVLVKRFTSKEERRRVSAAVSDPDATIGSRIAFENHLNVFHRGGRGLEMDLALGLATFLNCALIDSYVRLFNGHTQINATDLRNLRYPSMAQLRELGARRGASDASMIDDLVDSVVGSIGRSRSRSDGALAKKAA